LTISWSVPGSIVSTIALPFEVSLKVIVPGFSPSFTHPRKPTCPRANESNRRRRFSDRARRRRTQCGKCRTTPPRKEQPRNNTTTGKITLNHDSASLEEGDFVSLGGANAASRTLSSTSDTFFLLAHPPRNTSRSGTGLRCSTGCVPRGGQSATRRAQERQGASITETEKACRIRPTIRRWFAGAGPANPASAGGSYPPALQKCGPCVHRSHVTKW